MSKWRSPYKEDRLIPLLGFNGRTVSPGEVVSVPEHHDVEFEAAGWEPVKEAPAVKADKAEKEAK